MTTRSQILQRGTPLARALAEAQFAELHSRVIDAPPEQVWSVLHTLKWSELPLTRLLMTVRLAGRGDLERRLVEPPSPAAPILEEPPHLLTSGMIGKPWEPKPVQGPAVESLQQLCDFDAPGWLKYGMEMLLVPLSGGRTLVETATICEATDVRARRRFGAYWSLIRVFSGVVRRDMLAGIQRKCARPGRNRTVTSVGSAAIGR